VQSRLSEYRAQLDGEPERLAVFRDIDANLKVTELSASMALSVILAIAAGAIESQPQGSSPEMLAAVEERVRAMYPSLLEQMRDQILGSLAWTYRDVSVEDLTAYADFLQSDSAKAVYAAVNSTMSETLEAGARKIGEEFGVFLRQKRT